MPQPAHAGRPDTTSLYLGFKLKHPFIAGASPLTGDLDGVRRLEDAGAAAIVLPSLFEEQITSATSGRIHGIDPNEGADLAERLAAFPPAGDYPSAPEQYLEHVRRAKAAVAVPVIASLNGTGSGEWLREAKRVEEAGADALEVNIYEVACGLDRPGMAIETDIVRLVTELKSLLKIPIAIKLSPFFTAFANVAHRLDLAGVDGLVMFNRFYQPDIDSRSLTVVPSLELSRHNELLLRLRWLAILHGRVRASLAATGGVEEWNDGVKAILAGAHAVQMASALLRHGPGMLTTMHEKLLAWMEGTDTATVDAMRGRVSLMTVPDPTLFERAHYIRTLHQHSH